LANYSVSSTGSTVWQVAVSSQVNPTKYTIWNYRNVIKMITITILSSGSNATLPSYVFSIGENVQPSIFTAILDNDQTSGYMYYFSLA
jgi:hypothetical protein